MMQSSKKINKVSLTSITLQEALKAELSKLPAVNTVVQGYNGVYSINLTDLLGGARFSRSFDLTLQMAINEIKENNHLDKAQLHGALLEKYLGISRGALAHLQALPQPNAYQSLPIEANDDYNLHLFFLKPFRLFGLTDQDRKFTRINPGTGDREWLWCDNGSDSAPLFRKIIQIYILSDIVQDYETAANPFRDEQIAAVLPQMEALRTDLLKQIPVDLSTLLSTMRQEAEVTRGLASNSNFWSPILIYPKVRNVLSMYPITRLLFGQPSIEPHHNVASAASSKMGYIFIWLYTHLNLSTSIFWLKIAVKLGKIAWQGFRDYVTNPRASFTDLIIYSFWFVPIAAIFAAMPLLLTSFIYGVTSIPFSLVRSLILYGPRSLRSFTTLKFIDTIELIKDGILFWWAAMPLLLNFLRIPIIFMLNIINPYFAIIASIVIHFKIFMIYASMVPSSARFRDFLLSFIASITTYIIFLKIIAFSLPAAMLLVAQMMEIIMAMLGVASYLSLGVIARYCRPYVPAVLSNGFFQLTSLVTSGIERLLTLVNAMSPENSLVVNSQPPIILPRTGEKLKISPDKVAEAGHLFNHLGKMNQLPNLSAERKKVIRKCLDGLDTDEVTSIENLQEAIKTAKELLQLNFSANEANLMEALARHFSYQNQENGQSEINAIRVQGSQGAYQPSWAMIAKLEEQGVIRNGRWYAPAGIAGLTPEMLKKCEEIRALKLRAAG